MTNISRRGFLGAIISAPAIVRVSSLMPVKAYAGIAPPKLIDLVRRTFPGLVAYDICGAQPMLGPTGQIFAMSLVESGAHGSLDSVAVQHRRECFGSSFKDSDRLTTKVL